MEPWQNDLGCVASLEPQLLLLLPGQQPLQAPPRSCQPQGPGRCGQTGVTSHLLEEAGCTNPKILSVHKLLITPS